jgi:hypothetical protein
MSDIDALIRSLKSGAVAQNVGIDHDEARMQYRPRGNRVSSVREFERIIGDYYNQHFSRTVGSGQLRHFEAVQRAKQILTREYRRRNKSLVNAVHDAKEGTNGGMRAILDTLADALKNESTQHYMQETLDQARELDSWHQRVDLARQFQQRYGHMLGDSVQSLPAEAFAHDFDELIQSYVQHIDEVEQQFRRVGR